MMSNYHTHSIYCDGEGKPEEYVEYALSRHFDALGFSGHAPLPFPNSWTMDEESLPLYLEEIRGLKERFADRIEIYLGSEIDYLDENRNPAEEKYRSLGLDYAIGSVHHIYSPEQETFVPVDSTKEELDRLAEETFGGNMQALVSEYYRMVRHMVETGGFDIIGHLDLIKKHNADNRYFDESAPWYREEIQKTLEVIAEKGEESPILEINTGAMALGYTGEPYPSPWILEAAAELGVPVMLNSDAHKPKWIDYGFAEAERTIRKSGYSSRRVLLGGEWREVAYE